MPALQGYCQDHHPLLLLLLLLARPLLVRPLVSAYLPLQHFLLLAVQSPGRLLVRLLVRLAVKPLQTRLLLQHQACPQQA
jgi:hypothetical protein